LAQDLSHAVGPEKLDGVGGWVAAEDDLQVVNLGGLERTVECEGCANKRPTSPTRFGRPTTLCTVGPRKSASTRITRLPPCVTTAARLAEMVVLPSCWPGLVMSSVRSGRSTEANWTLVRKERKASVAGERAWRTT